MEVTRDHLTSLKQLHYLVPITSISLAPPKPASSRNPH